MIRRTLFLCVRKWNSQEDFVWKIVYIGQNIVARRFGERWFCVCENEIGLCLKQSFTINHIIGQNKDARWLGERWFCVCEKEIVKRILFEKSLRINQSIGQNRVARWWGERWFCVCENEIVKRIMFENSLTVYQTVGQKTGFQMIRWTLVLCVRKWNSQEDFVWKIVDN